MRLGPKNESLWLKTRHISWRAGWEHWRHLSWWSPYFKQDSLYFLINTHFFFLAVLGFSVERPFPLSDRNSPMTVFYCSFWPVSLRSWFPNFSANWRVCQNAQTWQMGSFQIFKIKHTSVLNIEEQNFFSCSLVASGPWTGTGPWARGWGPLY